MKHKEWKDLKKELLKDPKVRLYYYLLKPKQMLLRFFINLGEFSRKMVEKLW